MAPGQLPRENQEPARASQILGLPGSPRCPEKKWGFRGTSQNQLGILGCESKLRSRELAGKGAAPPKSPFWGQPPEMLVGERLLRWVWIPKGIREQRQDGEFREPLRAGSGQTHPWRGVAWVEIRCPQNPGEVTLGTHPALPGCSRGPAGISPREETRNRPGTGGFGAGGAAGFWGGGGAAAPAFSQEHRDCPAAPGNHQRPSRGWWEWGRRDEGTSG